MSEIITARQVKELFPKRKSDTHKGNYGYVALVGGCVKYSGAVRLAALGQSSLRAGAGVCTIAAPKSLTDTILPNILENTFFPLDDEDGDLIFQKQEFDELMENNDLIAIGMGIGNTEETRKAVKYLLEEYDGVLVVDADGINALAKLGKENIRHHNCKLVITPHPREFARLSRINIKDVLADPETHARKLAEDIDAIVLLKGHVSTVTDGSITYRVERGCPGMATAGSGDVLSGILSAMLAVNKNRLLIAVAAGAFVNGLAGELASQKKGEYSMLASDTASEIGNAIRLIVNDSVYDRADSCNIVPMEESLRGRETAAAQSQKKIVLHIIFCVVFVIILGLCVYFAIKEIKRSQLAAEPALEVSDQRELVEDYAMKLDFVYKDIYIDGILINNYQLFRPFGMFDGHIYVPLTEELCKALGVRAEYVFTREREDLIITRDIPGMEGAFYDVYGWNPYPIKGFACGNITVYLENEEKQEILYPDACECFSYDDGEVMYVPISMLAASDVFGISTFYDEMTGLYISTDEDIPAESYYSENNAAYIKGRSEYILSYQPQLGLGVCSLYEYIFRHEANTMGVDEDLLLAIARTESSFNRWDVSPAGAKGIMQIMPDTAKSQGIDPDSLFDIEVSIQFGAYYLKNALANFDDEVKALSCYNFGGNAVLAGEYDTGYATRVRSRRDDLRRWITDMGYSNEFYTVLECTK